MERSIFNIAEAFADAGRLIHVRATACTVAGVSWYETNRRRRALVQVGAGVALLGVAAGAQAAGLADLFTAGAVQSDSIKLSGGRILSAGGFGAVGYGAFNWYRKGKEGENSHIKGGQIAVPMLAGGALGAVGVLMIKAAETIGLPGVGV